jgi:mRNA interferase MazF
MPARWRPSCGSSNAPTARSVSVVVAAITSNLSLALAPGNVACRPKASGLPRPSVINVSQLVSVGRGTLTERVSRLPEAVMRQVDDGLRLVLAL